MTNEIKDFSRVLAELEDGQFNADCSQKLQESLKALQERCDLDGCSWRMIRRMNWECRYIWGIG